MSQVTFVILLTPSVLRDDKDKRLFFLPKCCYHSYLQLNIYVMTLKSMASQSSFVSRDSTMKYTNVI